MNVFGKVHARSNRHFGINSDPWSSQQEFLHASKGKGSDRGETFLVGRVSRK